MDPVGILAMKHFLRTYWFQIAAVFLLCGISFGSGWWVNEASGDPNEMLIKLAYRQMANDSLFNALSDQELANAAVRGMIAAIDDPYAELIEPQAAQNFSHTFRGNTGVVGLYAANIDRQAVITIVYPNTPAERAGIQVGDVIVAIDGESLDPDADSSETGLRIRGVPGTNVHLTTRRDGQVMEFDLVRKEQSFVASRMLPGQVGLISLYAYNQNAARQMKAAIETLLAQGAVGILWDLRNNEGGDMQAAQDILSYFIEDGLLFTAELTNSRTVAFHARGNALAGDVPLVVLMDHTTYSAAETSAAAVAETGRGVTVGSRSYGKGIIQATNPLANGTMLQMTVARWLSPNGTCYHAVGVEPQVQVVDDPASEEDEVLQVGLELLRKGASARAVP